MEVKDGGLNHKFKNAINGLYAFNSLQNIEIAGNDKVFYLANPKIIDRKTVLVSNDKVSNLNALRYGWEKGIVGTSYTTNLLPMPSFRTDNGNDAQKRDSN